MNINKNSRLLKITDNEDIMAGFHERFRFYRDITNQCLQYAFETELLSLNQGTMTIHVNDQTLRRLPYNRKFSIPRRIAPKLARLFKQDARTIYIYFGIKQL